MAAYLTVGLRSLEWGDSANRGDLVIELGSQGFFLGAGGLKAASTSS